MGKFNASLLRVKWPSDLKAVSKEAWVERQSETTEKNSSLFVSFKHSLKICFKDEKFQTLPDDEMNIGTVLQSFPH